MYRILWNLFDFAGYRVDSKPQVLQQFIADKRCEGWDQDGVEILTHQLTVRKVGAYFYSSSGAHKPQRTPPLSETQGLDFLRGQGEVSSVGINQKGVLSGFLFTENPGLYLCPAHEPAPPDDAVARYGASPIPYRPRLRPTWLPH